MTLRKSYFMNNIMGRVGYSLLITYIFKKINVPLVLYFNIKYANSI